MIEIATCMNDVAEKATWRQGSELARINRVWTTAGVTYVGFHLWNYVTERKDQAWTRHGVKSEDDFTTAYYYEASSDLNQAREEEKVEYLLTCARTEISSNFAGYEERQAGLKALDLFAKLVKAKAGYEIIREDHTADDTVYCAAAGLIDDGKLTADEIKDLTA